MVLFGLPEHAFAQHFRVKCRHNIGQTASFFQYADLSQNFTGSGGAAHSEKSVVERCGLAVGRMDFLQGILLLSGDGNDEGHRFSICFVPTLAVEFFFRKYRSRFFVRKNMRVFFVAPKTVVVIACLNRYVSAMQATENFGFGGLEGPHGF